MRRFVARAAYDLAKSRAGSALVRTLWTRFHGVLPLRRLYDSDRIVAFRHPRPGYPVHVVLVPKSPLPGIGAVVPADGPALAELYATAARLADEVGLRDGYRVVVNAGRFQHVPQLHAHLIPPAVGAARS